MSIDAVYFNKDGIIKSNAPLAIKQENFINKARLVYGDLYDYSKVVYLNAKTKVTIICKTHGEFLAIPNNHLNGTGGCPICAGNVKHTIGDFTELLNQKFGTNLFSLKKFKYINYKTKGIVVCNKCNHEFVTTPNNMLSNNVGCPNCHTLNIANKRIYIAKCTNIPDVFKLGISNNPTRRVAEVARLGKMHLDLLYESAEIASNTARDIESKLHNSLPPL